MRKILIISLLFTIILFPSSHILAADKCDKSTTSLCPDGSKVGTTGLCSGGQGLPTQQTVWTCSQSNTGPSSQDDTCECRTGLSNPVTPNSPAAAPTSTPCTGSGCTSGKGQTCTDGTTSGVKTAIGCVPTEPKELINGLLRTLTFASGGIAFLIMLLAALQMITAEGNPQAIKGAQEKFYSAIIGLLLIIFSVLLMQVIGVDILGLPGFGPTK